MPATQRLLFTSRRADADPVLLADPAVAAFTWPGFARAVRDPDLELLEVAEPLWVGEWVRAVRCVVLAHVVRLLSRRRRLTVATYAIDNLDDPARVSSRAAGALLRTSVVLLDAIAFGTSGARDTYERAFGRTLARTTHVVLPPRLGECTVCGPPSASTPREPTVVFLGAPGERKGFGVLLAAWELAGLADAGWRLVVADPSGRPAPGVPRGVSVLSCPPRGAVHELLRTAAVVAMPSVRMPHWREQIGLPLVEGLAHGCRVVTTPETGLADDLAAHPLVTFTTAGDAASLAGGLRRAMTPAAGRAPEGHAKSDVVAWWLSLSGSRPGRRRARSRR